MNFKLLVDNILEDMYYEELILLYRKLCDEANDTEEFWGATVYRGDKEYEDISEYVFKYIEKRFPEQLKNYRADE